MNDDKFDGVVGPVSIVSTGKKTVQKEDFEAAIEVPTSVGESMDDIYDHYSRLIYTIDASGSMRGGMLQEDRINRFLWTDSMLKNFRERIAAEQLENGDDTEVPVSSLSDAELKMKIIDEGLNYTYGIKLPINSGFVPKTRSKMQAVKDAAKDFVQKRFRKFPDAKVTVFGFETQPYLLSAGEKQEDVLLAISRLQDTGGGGTNIFAAVEKAVGECKERPSQVGVHHIVLVSDGLDENAVTVRNLIPEMLRIGIVFDFIFIQGESGVVDSHTIEVLKDVCEQTGGEFSVVRTEKDFVQKFLTASERKCLPPGPK